MRPQSRRIRLLYAVAALALANASCSLVESTSAAARVERRNITAIPADPPYRILCVVAHPDDEISFAGTIFKASTALSAGCDVLTITNGEAGYKYSTLAERLYGLELTDPEIGRRHLPAIRREELSEGLSYLGARDLYLLNERDDGYSKDRFHVLDPKTTPWNLDRVRRVIADVLERGDYDFVFTHLPTLETHGHHQCATLLALEAVGKMPEAQRPAIFGTRHRSKNDEPKPPYVGLADEPTTLPASNVTPLEFDRTQTFGYGNRLNYKIVVNWAIAAHKSQGTMQLGIGRSDIEEYWPYATSTDAALAKAREFFEKLRAPQFPAKVYPGEVPREATPAADTAADTPAATTPPSKP
jgi:N-acetylglucosamine malate deacetylase 2